MPKTVLSDASVSLINDAIKKHRLPVGFATTVNEFYLPLCSQIASQIGISTSLSKHHFIGIQGTQGSGKSTCAAFVKLMLESEFGFKVLVASIDDFYLSLAERQALVKTVHPLLLTRGVPGTHDVGLMKQFLLDTAKDHKFLVPSFNKASDDRLPTSRWPQYQGPFDIVILEGWCVGVPPQNEAALSVAINDFEQQEDASQQWRRYVNEALSGDYQEVFQALDMLITLQAPSFDCVYRWRALQEQKMIDKLRSDGRDTSSTMSPAQLKRFISHYQRLTEHALEILPGVADAVLYLDEDHHFTHMQGVEF